MPKYKIEAHRTQTQICKIEVEAPSADQAWEAAAEQGIIYWEVSDWDLISQEGPDYLKVEKNNE